MILGIDMDLKFLTFSVVRDKKNYWLGSKEYKGKQTLQFQQFSVVYTEWLIKRGRMDCISGLGKVITLLCNF